MSACDQDSNNSIRHSRSREAPPLHAPFPNIRKQADLVRNIDLVAVLKQTAAIADQYDRSKWYTPRGVISVTGRKFFKRTRTVGGGGAIDLIMHLQDYDFITAVSWLIENFPSQHIPTSAPQKPLAGKTLALPNKNLNNLPQVARYLTLERCLPADLVRSLIDARTLYADDRANAVFLLLGKGKTIVGAEIRGTTKRTWHALAPGSRKDLGYFHVGSHKTSRIVLCESAIDAISCHALDSDCMAISTAGAHPNPPWLPSLTNKGLDLFCGFDADNTGDTLAQKMMALHPTIRRLRPTLHDWNDVLKSSPVNPLPTSSRISGKTTKTQSSSPPVPTPFKRTTQLSQNTTWKRKTIRTASSIVL